MLEEWIPACAGMTWLSMETQGRMVGGVAHYDKKSGLQRMSRVSLSCGMANMATDMLEKGCAVSFETIEPSVQSPV